MHEYTLTECSDSALGFLFFFRKIRHKFAQSILENKQQWHRSNVKGSRMKISTQIECLQINKHSSSVIGLYSKQSTFDFLLNINF